MTTDKQKIEIMQAHLDGAEIECLGGSCFEDWGLIREPSWNWHLCEYRIKEKQHYFADGSLVTEEAKNGKFVRPVHSDAGTIYTLCDDSNVAGMLKFSMNIKLGYVHFRWSEVLPYIEPEYIPFDKDTFPFEPVWIRSVEEIPQGVPRREYLITAKDIVQVHFSNASISYYELFDDWEIVNPDGTRSPAGKKA